ncbi:hypothetical protein STEG23_022141, partial [Scotinomys teguina]
SAISITLKSQGSVILRIYGRSSRYYNCGSPGKEKKALTKCDFLQLELNLSLSNQNLLCSLPSEHVSADRRTKGGARGKGGKEPEEPQQQISTRNTNATYVNVRRGKENGCSYKQRCLSPFSPI